MKTPLMKSLLVAGIVSGFGASAQAQSDSFCANAADSSRIIRTGATRAVAGTFDGLRICMTAEGFSDSTDFHPVVWPSQSRIVVYETLRPGDARRMESSQVTTTWTRNGSALPNDSTAAAWRAAVRSALEARWELVTLRQEEAGYQAEIAATVRKQKEMKAEIDSTRKLAARLNASINSLRTQDRQLRQSLSAAQQRASQVGSQLSGARSAVASATTEQARRQAEDRVRTLESEYSRQNDNLHRLERQVDQFDVDRKIGLVELELKGLNPDNRIAFLDIQLAALDPEARFADLRAALASLDADNRSRKLETQLAEAVAKLNAILK
jgi:hypothetical protein